VNLAKESKMTLVFLLLLFFLPVLCYSGIYDTQYDFSQEHWNAEQKEAWVNFFWNVLPALLLVVSFFVAFRFDKPWSKVLPILALTLFFIIPAMRFNIWRLRVMSEENNTPYSSNPACIIKKHPLSEGFTKEEVLRLWGKPRKVFIGLVEETWYYSRIEPKMDVSTEFGEFEWNEKYKVELIFHGDKLITIAIR
jgi:hypothetical protein